MWLSTPRSPARRSRPVSTAQALPKLRTRSLASLFLSVPEHAARGDPRTDRDGMVGAAQILRLLLRDLGWQDLAGLHHAILGETGARAAG